MCVRACLRACARGLFSCVINPRFTVTDNRGNSVRQLVGGCCQRQRATWGRCSDVGCSQSSRPVCAGGGHHQQAARAKATAAVQAGQPRGGEGTESRQVLQSALPFRLPHLQHCLLADLCGGTYLTPPPPPPPVLGDVRFYPAAFSSSVSFRWTTFGETSLNPSSIFFLSCCFTVHTETPWGLLGTSTHRGDY